MEMAGGWKVDAFIAMGVLENYVLTSLEEFFTRHFGGNKG